MDAICDGCKFRIIINNSSKFHCAADANGWAYILDIGDNITMPSICNKKIVGRSLKVIHELKSDEFWEIAGKHITCQDWAKIR